MNFENVSKIESNFLFVILFPAIIIFVYILYLFSYVFTQIDIAKLFPLLNGKSYNLIIIMLASYVMAMFVHGIRYVGFIYYKMLYDKGIKNIGTRLLFSLFRKGTVVEECYARSREENCSYEWINDVKKEGGKLIKSMWRIASSIDKEQNVYQFYFYSEVFQCCETTFVFMCTFQIFAVVYLIMHQNQVLFLNVVLTAIFLLMFFVSRLVGIAFANRFIHDIDIKRKVQK